MSTRVDAGGPSTGVSATPTASRVTPAPSRPFKQVMDASASAVVGGAEAAVRRLPGGPVLAAAFRPGPSATQASAGLGGGSSRAEGSAGTAGGSEVEGGGNMEEMLNRNADMNLYYLELQERISAESRAYTTLSNVLKTRHDTVKNAIGNIR
ncbi:MAG: hypothetical protein U0263_26225 [Polyangiaceae bacterium]